MLLVYEALTPGGARMYSRTTHVVDLRDPAAAEPAVDAEHLGLRDAARARRRPPRRVLHGPVPVPGRMVFLFLVIVVQMLQPAVLTSGLFRQFITISMNNVFPNSAKR